MKNLKLAFPTGDDGVQKRTLKRESDYILAWYEPNDFKPVDIAEYPMKPDDVWLTPKQVVTMFENSAKEDRDRAVEMAKKYHQGADWTYEDKSMDKDDVTNMVQRGMKFKVGDRVLDTSLDDEGYATVIGVKPGEVLLDYADLSGEAWRDAIFVDHVLPDNDYRFRDYEDWKLRGIDKTL